MDEALVTGVMAGAVLSATLPQGFRLWRADHAPDPALERRAAAATWLLVFGVAVVVANGRTSAGAIERLGLMVPLGAGLLLHPRAAAGGGVAQGPVGPVGPATASTAAPGAGAAVTCRV